MPARPFYVKGAQILLCLVIIVAGLYYGRAFFIPFFTALLLACLVLPAVRNLEALRFPPWAAALSGVLVVVAVTGAIGAFLWVQLGNFYQNFDAVALILQQQVTNFERFAADSMALPAAQSEEWIEGQKLRIATWAGNFAMSLLGAREDALTRALLIPFLMFFALLYRHRLTVLLARPEPASSGLFLTADAAADTIVPQLDANPVVKVDRPIDLLQKITVVVQRYVRGVLLVAVIVWICSTCAFTAIGLQHAVLAGLLFALLNIIPYIGFLIGALFPMLIALIQQGEPSLAVAALSICAFLHLLDVNLLTPRALGPCISLNPLTTMLALVAGALLWGMAGMILAVLIAGIAKIALDHVAGTRPFGYLLGDENDYGAPMPARTTLILPEE
jgi:predicted PurR-regulated permease PerM